MSDPTPENPSTPSPAKEVKPGWKTSEFYFRHLSIGLSVLIASNVIPVESTLMKIVTIAALWLTAEGYSVSRTFIKSAAMAFVIVWFASHSAACGASGRDKAFRDTYAALNSAQIAFVTYDGIHQHEIVVNSKDEESFNRAAHEWRGTQLTIEQLFTDAYKDLSNAVIVNDDPSFATATQALSDLIRQLRAQGVKL